MKGEGAPGTKQELPAAVKNSWCLATASVSRASVVCVCEGERVRLGNQVVATVGRVGLALCTRLRGYPAA